MRPPHRTYTTTDTANKYSVPKITTATASSGQVVATNALKALSRKTADGLEIAGIAVSGRRAAEFRTSTDGAITFPREVLNERIQRLNDAAE